MGYNKYPLRPTHSKGFSAAKECHCFSTICLPTIQSTFDAVYSITSGRFHFSVTPSFNLLATIPTAAWHSYHLSHCPESRNSLWLAISIPQCMPNKDQGGKWDITCTKCHNTPSNIIPRFKIHLSVFDASGSTSVFCLAVWPSNYLIKLHSSCKLNSTRAPRLLSLRA